MKTPLLFCIFGIGSVLTFGADLNGTWRLDLPRRGDVALHTYFVLSQKEANLEGKVVINGAVDLPLRKAHFEGEMAVFSVDWNTEYHLRLDGERLRVTLIYNPKDSEEGVALRVPESEANPPASIPLPVLAPVAANGLAQTPPMGWNSWNHFGDKVDDRTVRESADVLVSSGLAAAGYQYINIDDCWEGGRDKTGNIVPNAKFPNMKALADYVHSRGLKIGLYSSPGPLTCGGYEGSYGHELQDAKTYASWGIDYLKHDWCSAARVYTEGDLQAAYQKMGQALAECGRPIVYSLCEYGMGDVWKWGTKVGANLWRTTGDIQDNWKSMAEIGFNQGPHAPFAGPGHWNDPDMLEVGNGGMTAVEYRTHFSLWCLLSAPLMAGNDLREMSPETLEILANPDAIAIDQDPLGKQAERAFAREGSEVWKKPMKDDALAVGLFNRTEDPQKVSFTWADLGRKTPPKKLRDAWKHQDLDPSVTGFSATVPAHGVVLLRLQ